MQRELLTLDALDSLDKKWRQKRLDKPKSPCSANEEQATIEKTAEAEYFKYIPCPICGTDQYKVFHERIRMGRQGWKHKLARALASLLGSRMAAALVSSLLGRSVSLHSRDYRLMQCLLCGFFFRNPTYTEKGLDRAYNRGTYAKFLTGDYSGERRELYGYIYDQIDLGGRTAHFSRKRLLDFGCGVGLFLDFMRSKGWDPHGFDFASDCIELGKRNFGLENIRAGSLDEKTFDGDFDAVSLISVAAHLTDPMDTFRRIHRILRPGGVLLIWTVNASSYTHRTHGPRWGGFTPNHVVFFDPDSIVNALSKAGFAKVEFGYDERQFKRLEGQGLIAAEQTGALAETFKQQNLGDMMIVFATNGSHAPT